MDLKGLTKALNGSHSRSDAHAKSAAHARINLLGATAAHAKRSATSQHEKLVKQAKTLVAQTFFGTLMKQMRDSPFKSSLFDGGRGGEAFGAMYDQQLAEKMSSGAGKQLVNSIVNRLEARANAVKHQVSIKPRTTAKISPVGPKKETF
jgi:Rod binding domain-containing protein